MSVFLDRARLGVIVALISALTLAINDVSVPFSYERGFNPPTVVLIRYVFLVLALAILLPLMNHPLRLPAGAVGHAMGSGVCASLGTLGLLGSFAYIPVTLAVVVLYIFPFLTALMEAIYRRQVPTPIELACPLVALLGIGMAIGLEPQTLDPRGLLLAALSAVGYAASFFWNSIALRDHDGTTVTFYIASAGVIIVSAYVFTIHGFASAPFSLDGWVPVLFTSLFFTIACVCMFKSVELSGGPTAAMVLNLEPIFVVLLAGLFLAESWTWSRVLGCLLVVAAVITAEIWRTTRAPKPALT